MPLPLLTYRTDSPEENLATDEALLDWCSAAESDGALRFWMSPVPFVVLSHSNAAAAEADLGACDTLGCPVLRRCSGGGAVVQGPGCLNYCLVLRVASHPQCASIPSTNRFVMETHRRAIQPRLSQPVEIRGITDLAVADRKFSGNAQKRGRTHLLFHGTFLLDFDLALIQRVLRMPSRIPPYRQHRPHTDFVMNLGIEPDRVQQALAAAWQVEGTIDPAALQADVQRLLRDRYSQPAWHTKF